MNLGFLNKKLTIAGYNVPILYPLLIAGVGAFIALKGKGAPTMPQAVDSAPDVTFNLNPPMITPNVPTSLVGQFNDGMGKPVTVKAGYYYVFLVQPTGMKKLISQGSVGMNVSNFSVPINTAGLMPAGANKYSLVVTDIPLSQQELM